MLPEDLVDQDYPFMKNVLIDQRKLWTGIKVPGSRVVGIIRVLKVY